MLALLSKNFRSVLFKSLILLLWYSSFFIEPLSGQTNKIFIYFEFYTDDIDKRTYELNKFNRVLKNKTNNYINKCNIDVIFEGKFKNDFIEGKWSKNHIYYLHGEIKIKDNENHIVSNTAFIQTSKINYHNKYEYNFFTLYDDENNNCYDLMILYALYCNYDNKSEKLEIGGNLKNCIDTILHGNKEKYQKISNFIDKYWFIALEDEEILSFIIAFCSMIDSKKISKEHFSQASIITQKKEIFQKYTKPKYVKMIKLLSSACREYNDIMKLTKTLNLK